MTYKQGYSTMFYLLSEYYFKNTNSSDLAVLLGSMNPEIFEDSKAVDFAYWEDWKRILKEKEIMESMSIDNLLDSIIAFLEFYQKTFDFKLSEVLEKVKELSNESELLVKCINKKMDK